jgi:hypothetical protein
LPISRVMPSAVIASIDYDPGTGTLTVQFTSGTVYEYKNVPAEVYAAMKKAFSKGVFLNKHIKGKFECRKKI